MHVSKLSRRIIAAKETPMTRNILAWLLILFSSLFLLLSAAGTAAAWV